MRFLLKAFFLIGLVAFAMPFVTGERTVGSAAPDAFTLMAGAQEAFSDITGFCQRAPAACAAGGEIARFAGERIRDGVALAYNWSTDGLRGPAEPTTSAVEPVEARSLERGLDTTLPPPTAYKPPLGATPVRATDPVTTATVPAPPPPGAPALPSRLPLPSAAPRA